MTTGSAIGATVAADTRIASNQPLVSIGLPVFNGAQFLAQALESLLSQTYSNIEIIISDNASTDSTPAICSRLAAVDHRIRYSRLSENIGGIPNHNRVFSLATGKYFMWASHDDLVLPEYIEKCVECLEGDTSVVLAYARTSIIDESGQVQKRMMESHQASASRPAERFREFTELYSILEAFPGVMRREILQNTSLHLPHPGSDRLLLAELSLRGRFTQIPEYLFKRRVHAGRSISTHPTLRDRYSWIMPAFKGKRVFPHWAYLAGYASAILRAPLAFRDKVSCAVVVLRLVRYSWRELLDDLRP